MKRIILNVALVVLLFGLAPVALLAQDDLTLESLHETVQGVMADIQIAGLEIRNLKYRMDTIETIWKGPGAVDLGDGACQIATDGGLQNETVLKYKDMFGEWPPIDQMRVLKVVYSEPARIDVTWQLSFIQTQVTETWLGCEFQISSDWWELDWEGNRLPYPRYPPED